MRIYTRGYRHILVVSPLSKILHVPATPFDADWAERMARRPDDRSRVGFCRVTLWRALDRAPDPCSLEMEMPFRDSAGAVRHVKTKGLSEACERPAVLLMPRHVAQGFPRNCISKQLVSSIDYSEQLPPGAFVAISDMW